MLKNKSSSQLKLKRRFALTNSQLTLTNLPNALINILLPLLISEDSQKLKLHFMKQVIRHVCLIEMIKTNVFEWYQIRFLLNWILYEIHMFFILQIKNKQHSYICTLSDIVKIPSWIFYTGLIEFYLFLTFWRINTFICHIFIIYLMKTRLPLLFTFFQNTFSWR